jgi:hypothetical protein
MTNLPLCDLATEKHQKSYVDFPRHKDAKGRVIGADIHRFLATFTQKSEDARNGYRHEPGTFFGFRPHATRNGLPYGASQSRQYFKTEAEREQAISAYLANAMKRAAKKGA